MFACISKQLASEISRFVKMGIFFIRNHPEGRDNRVISCSKALDICKIWKGWHYFATICDFDEPKILKDKSLLKWYNFKPVALKKNCAMPGRHCRNIFLI